MENRKWDECLHHDKSAIHNISHLPLAYELEMHRIIQCQAYLLAERDGFKRSPLDYWLAAEKCIYQDI